MRYSAKHEERRFLALSVVISACCIALVWLVL